MTTTGSIKSILLFILTFVSCRIKKKANNGRTKNHVTKDNNKRYNRTFLSIITQKRSNFQKPLKSFKFILKLCFLYMERYLEKQRVSIHILMDAWSPSTVSKAITYICRVKRGYSFMTVRKKKKGWKPS